MTVQQYIVYVCHSEIVQASAAGLVSSLVSWSSEPSQLQRVTSGLKTNFSLSLSKLSIPQVITPQVSFSQILSTISERRPRKTITGFGAYLYSAGTQHGNLHPAGWLTLFCGPTQELVLATANTGKTWERFGKMQLNGPGGYKLAQKKSLAVSIAYMYDHILPYSRL